MSRQTFVRIGTNRCQQLKGWKRRYHAGRIVPSSNQPSVLFRHEGLHDKQKSRVGFVQIRIENQLVRHLYDPCPIEPIDSYDIVGVLWFAQYDGGTVSQKVEFTVCFAQE